MKILESVKFNWQPTAVFSGLGGAIATSMGWTDGNGKINWGAVIVWLLATLGGVVSKQHNVTGGDIPATKEAEARTTAAKSAPSTK